MTISVNINIKDGITPVLQGMQKQLKQYPKDAEYKFITLTPVKTGNARRSTYLRNSKEIIANYPYAQRLDEGWSRQAPAGMTKPFEAWVRTKVKQIFGK
jgi:hypothetical protein